MYINYIEKKLSFFLDHFLGRVLVFFYKFPPLVYCFIGTLDHDKNQQEKVIWSYFKLCQSGWVTTPDSQIDIESVVTPINIPEYKRMYVYIIPHISHP